MEDWQVQKEMTKPRKHRLDARILYGLYAAKLE